MPIHKSLSFLLFLIKNRIRKFDSVDLPFVFYNIVFFSFLRKAFLTIVSSSGQGGAMTPVAPPLATPLIPESLMTPVVEYRTPDLVGEYP